MASRQDWIRGGQELLRGGGHPAVKLRSLSALLRLTTGSFYHHFNSFDEYLGELAAHYGEAADRLRAALAGQPPERRIRTLLSIRSEAAVPALDRAMRVWAASDERAGAAVERLDHAVLELVQTAFLELGFGRPEARMRALTAFAAGIGMGMLASPWPAGRDEEERAVALFLQR